MICPYPVSILNPVADASGFFDRMHVGCGKCGACKSNRRNEWSFRIMQEAKHSDYCHFITLTYHDSVVPLTENGLLTLSKRDVQLFNKSLRKEQSKLTNQKYRFFCVGEYGTKFHRPHYHLITFNLHPELAKPEVLLPIWWRGIVHMHPLDKGLTHYTTKYHVTTQEKERHLSYSDDRIDEFTIASNKPVEGSEYGGIGYRYIETHKQYHLSTGNGYVRNNGYSQRMPRYYYRHIFEELPIEQKEVLRRSAAELVEKTEKKELERLSKLGFQRPEIEYQRRLVAEAKNTVFKAKQKGRF